MKKQNSISYETSKLFFDASAASEEGGSYFIVRGGPESTRIDLPMSIMHRLFRLGQAYGFRQLRYFESDVKILVGQVEIPEFHKDLLKLLTLVNDEVLHEYVGQLIIAIESAPGPAVKSIAVSAGSYFEKRA